MLNIINGWLGEMTTQVGLWLTLDRTLYRSFHNLIVETQGRTTQIDHVVLSPYGLFVIETKNYRGWIFGSESQTQWTQVLYGVKHSFQNPLRQNFLHTQALSHHLHLEPIQLHSIIFFIGDAELKSPMPPNILTGSLSTYIQQFQTVIYDGRELKRLEQQLTHLKSAPAATAKEHVRRLEERHSNPDVCPRCGSSLVERLSKKGSFAGTAFLGCSSYPKCRFVKR